MNINIDAYESGQQMRCHACASALIEQVLWRSEVGSFMVVSSIERAEDLFAQEENAFLTITTFRSVRRSNKIIWS